MFRFCLGRRSWGQSQGLDFLLSIPLHKTCMLFCFDCFTFTDGRMKIRDKGSAWQVMTERRPGAMWSYPPQISSYMQDGLGACVNRVRGWPLRNYSHLYLSCVTSPAIIRPAEAVSTRLQNGGPSSRRPKTATRRGGFEMLVESRHGTTWSEEQAKEWLRLHSRQVLPPVCLLCETTSS